MAEPSPQKIASLEDQLRNMILSNVTISDSGPTNQGAATQGPQQHSRRGFPRGPPRNSQNHTHHGQHASIPHAGGQGSPLPDKNNRNRQPHPRSQSHHQAPNMGDTTSGAQDQTGAWNRRRNYNQGQLHQPRPQDQAFPHGPKSKQLTPGTSQGPKILQRPQQRLGPSDISPASPMTRYNHGPQLHYQQMNHVPDNNAMAQTNYLDRIASQEIPKVEISLSELEEKEAFRKYLEDLCKEAIAQGDFANMVTIDLVGFGSLASGFATPGSDMDLAVVPAWKESTSAQNTDIDRTIPRLLEKAVLEGKMGGRLLTRTRVPILKVCQKPTEELYIALYDERKKWDGMSEEEKYPPPPPPPGAPTDMKPLVEVDGEKPAEPMQQNAPDILGTQKGKRKTPDNLNAEDTSKIEAGTSSNPKVDDLQATDANKSHSPRSAKAVTLEEALSNAKEQKQHRERLWHREKVLGPLDFPKIGVGIQCDINFSNPLAIHNTHLLRCYSLCDPRVRPMVLFVKSWAKRRKINSSYSGTLSSYGWVLMVLHYLVNVAQPPVCPNLQQCWRPPTDIKGLEQMFKDTVVEGYAVRFWRNEQEIMQEARSGRLTRNTQSIGALLRGFFQYYASPPAYGPRPPTFFWTNEVLSLRTPGGIRTKAEKGWTGAKTTISAGKEVRHRYLFAIEDPFELDHNVARTVTHNGIVAIRDEFRRAWRILSAVGRNQQPQDGELFDEVVEVVPPKLEEKTVTTETLVVDGEERDHANIEIQET